MRIVKEYDYRNAKSILQHEDPTALRELLTTLNNPRLRLRLGAPRGGQQNISRQLQKIFFLRGWQKEKVHLTLPELRYDLFKGKIPVEIEIGHQRLVYADFFKFLIDYSAARIPAGVMIVTANPRDFGHKWHNSVDSTQGKIGSIQSLLFVPMLILGISP